MKTLLRIDSSIRTEGSHSRALADFFEAEWKQKNPDGQVVKRDLATTNIPHISQETITAFYTPKEHYTQAEKDIVALSDILVEELHQANDLLISSPLYNLSTPSTLKAYLDHIIRTGVSFRMDEEGNYHGLLSMDSAFIITAKGANYKGTLMEYMDFQEPYLKAVTRFVGIEIDQIFSLEGTAIPESLERNMAHQKSEIQKALNNNKK